MPYINIRSAMDLTGDKHAGFVDTNTISSTTQAREDVTYATACAATASSPCCEQLSLRHAKKAKEAKKAPTLISLNSLISHPVRYS
jgi:hypothetical protein